MSAGPASQAIPIRRAGPADVAGLARLGAATFVEAFGPTYAPEDLAAYLAASQSEASYGQLLADPGVGIWLGVADDGALAGFVVAGPCKLPVPEPGPADGEIRQLYLLARWQGRGLGTRLLTTALDWLQSRGHAPLYVGVWSLNPGAQRLYGRFGFEKVGEYDFPVGGHLDREFILRRGSVP